MPQRHTSDAVALPALRAGWSQRILNCGEANYGTLSLSLFVQGVQVAAQQIVVQGLPSGWTVTSNDGNWGVTGNTLVWNGEGPFDLDSNEQSVDIAVQPPKASGPSQIVASVMLADNNGNALTQTAPISFNLILPEQPLVAYANDSTYVILSGAGTVGYSNALSCTLRNTRQQPVSNVTIAVKLTALDSSGSQVDITQSLNSDKLRIACSGVTFSGGSGSWNGTTAAVHADQLLAITISGLELVQAAIGTVEVRFTISGVTQQPYSTSAWYAAVGPYSIAVSKDESNSSASGYQLRSSAGRYIVSVIGTSLNQPPLNMQILDRNGQPSYPPLPGGFSWMAGRPYFPSEHEFQAGANTLYWLDASVGGQLGVVTSCVIDLYLLSKESTPPLCITDMDLTSLDMSTWTNLAGVVSGGVIGAPKVPADWSWINGYLIGPGADLSGADLSNQDLSGCNGDNAKFAGANLSSVSAQNYPPPSFNGANFTGASFETASIIWGSFKSAIFAGANINGLSFGEKVDLKDADFTLIDTAYLQGITDGGDNTTAQVLSVAKLPKGWRCCTQKGFLYDYCPEGQTNCSNYYCSPLTWGN